MRRHRHAPRLVRRRTDVLNRRRVHALVRLVRPCALEPALGHDHVAHPRDNVYRREAIDRRLAEVRRCKDRSVGRSIAVRQENVLRCHFRVSPRGLSSGRETCTLYVCLINRSASVREKGRFPRASRLLKARQHADLQKCRHKSPTASCSPSGRRGCSGRRARRSPVGGRTKIPARPVRHAQSKCGCGGETHIAYTARPPPDAISPSLDTNAGSLSLRITFLPNIDATATDCASFVRVKPSSDHL